MIKEYGNSLVEFIPLTTVVMVLFFVLFMMVIWISFKLSKAFVMEASQLPLDEFHTDTESSEESHNG